ncbi:DUF3103 family protein [Tenacibaculum sp. SZ-18]
MCKDLILVIINGVFLNSWYTSYDDYVDSFYKIEKNKNYKNHNESGGN